MIKVFYSWQSDLPNKFNRSYIQKALEKAIKAINQDIAVELEVRFDQDTKGVTGSPDISRIIFDKITNADIFVGDISIVENNEKRFFPNPNVLIEYGYALRHLGWENVIGIFNTTYGRVENLPFDLNHRRPLTYSRNESQQVADDLSKNLQEAIQAIIKRSENLVRTSNTEIVRSLIQEMDDNLHLCRTTNVSNATHYEVRKFELAKDDDLQSIVSPEVYSLLRDVYTSFKQTNTLIGQLQGDGMKDHFTHTNLQTLKENLPEKLAGLIAQLRESLDKS